MQKRIVTFGEVLLRWSKNGRRRLSQGSQFNGNYGGSEANVAVSLATMGDQVEYVTRLPNNIIGRACRDELRYYGLDLNHIAWGGERLGTYYFEEAAAMRNSSVVYDRNNSAFNSMAPGMINWQNVFKGADIFHCSGITCAVSQSAADATFEAVQAAKDMNLTICCDINYRKNLWKYGADSRETLCRLMQFSDFIFGDQGEWEQVTGMPQIPLTTSTDEKEVDFTPHIEYVKRIHEMFPNCKRFIYGMRNQITSTHHTLTGILYCEGKIITTHIYDILNIVDPMGVGDAFVAGFVHASLRWPDDNQRCLDFALAAATMKNSIQGDFNLNTEEEILALDARKRGIEPETFYET